MKKIAFVSAIIACLAFTAQAQESMKGKTPQEKADHMTKKWTKDLSLTADQSTKLNALLMTKEQQVESIKAKHASDTDKKAMHADMKPVHDQFDSSMKQLLTPEQYTKYTAMKEQHKKHEGQHMN